MTQIRSFIRLALLPAAIAALVAGCAPFSKNASTSAASAPGAVTFNSLDTNRDWYLSPKEAASVAGPDTFDRFDVNRDGHLVRQEFDFLMRNTGTGVTRGAYETGQVYGPKY